MDLRTHGVRPAAEEIAAVDELLGVPSSNGEGEGLTGRVEYGGRAARDRRHLLLPVLHAVQDRCGWISPAALDYVAGRLSVAPAEAYGVASFYALFSLRPRPPLVVHVCDDIACLGAGAAELCNGLEASIGPSDQALQGGRSTWRRSPCLGLCDRAPAAFVQRAGDRFSHAEAGTAPTSAAAIRSLLSGETWPDEGSSPVPPGQPGLRLLRRCGVVDPGSLDSYRAAGGYGALRRAFEIGPENVIRELTDSRLMGRGGAAFPTGRKWQAVATSPIQPHYLVCNADESEPGTFKDRVLMEQDPFAVIEAMTIAAFATGCAAGYLYVRGEYPLAASRLGHAIDQARSRGLLGEDVMGHGVAFDIELRRGAGAYICGEETALFNSIEGLRGEPRNKPPFPVQAGLFKKPTLVNNVETLVNVLDIVLEGGQAFSRLGTPESTGTRLFCVSGQVGRPGIYEVACGTPLSELLERAGGVPGGLPRAILLGGAAGSFVTPEHLDMPLSFEGARAIGATLGSGVVMVFGKEADLLPVLLRIARFFRDESCGQCVPCRIGTARQEELLHRLAHRRPLASTAEEVTLLGEVAQAMRDASICGLGQTAANAVESAIQRLGVLDGNGRAP